MRVENILADIGEKPVVKDCCRIGRSQANATRPVKFSLSNQAHVTQVKKNARKLRTIRAPIDLYLS